jgi:hypothetical protein
MSRWVLAACFFPVAVTVTAACSRPRGSELPPQTGDAVRRAAAGAGTALRQDLRKLWTDHVIWMRAFIVSTAADLPDAQVASERLQRNQEEIGSLVGRHYGRSTGDQLTALLKEHVWSTVERLRATKIGDEGAQSRAEERAERNAAQMADLLSQANPNWSRGRIHELLRDRLAHVNEEIDFRIAGRWDADLKAFDASHKQILKLAEAFAEGIVRHYPEKLGG